MDNKSERRKYHFTYKTTCLITGRWYFGMHSTNDIDDGYMGSGTHLQNSLKKHGSENHILEIQEHLNTRAELRLREQEVLTEEFIADPLCMNIRFSCSAGNDPGFWATKDRAESSKKISATSKAMWARRKADLTTLAEHVAKLNKPEHVIKRAEAIKSKNHKRTPEQLVNLKAGQSKYYLTVDQSVLKLRGQKASITRVTNGTNLGGRPAGISMSDEQKMKQSKAWIIETEDGASLTIKNLKEFCDKNSISRTSFSRTKISGIFINGCRLMGQAS